MTRSRRPKSFDSRFSALNGNGPTTNSIPRITTAGGHSAVHVPVVMRILSRIAMRPALFVPAVACAITRRFTGQEPVASNETGRHQPASVIKGHRGKGLWMPQAPLAQHHLNRGGVGSVSRPRAPFWTRFHWTPDETPLERAFAMSRSVGRGRPGRSERDGTRSDKEMDAFCTFAHAVKAGQAHRPCD
jgi:hypothetical protein